MSEPSSHAAGPPETSIYRPVAEGPGARIGPYKLLQEIGEGGFGVVYMAEQQEPVRRKVALKIIKPGMDSKEVIARFESERQALALMDHPNIARVLDAGATETGRPYFVMELVRGVPITEYCDRNHLTASERLELFVVVCRAVQHAHQKGVIHRDLKPSNVMVTLHDGQPVPKVIDFGVAKATSQHLTERTLFTAYGQMVGTPAYMSPEQAEMSGLDIDTRSDIYSLGVLVYELLTGTTPFDMKRLRDAGYAELQRIIREEEPPKPSTRVSTLGEKLTVVSNHRRTDPTRLRQLLKGDLDLIVMKALEKERTRRYETPNSFAQDIERYLKQEAILARPPSALYRLRKFAQRNKAAVVTASAVVLCLLFGTIVSTLLAVQAIRERNRAQENVVIAERERSAADAARREAENQRDTAQKAKQAEENQRLLAETRRREAESARQAEAEQRALAEEKRRDVERQHNEIAGLNASLQKLSDEQRRTLYIAQMNLAQKAWESDNVGRVLELLDAQRPRPGQSDLRGFEWHYLRRLCHGDLATVKLPTTFEGLLSSFLGRDMDFSPDGSRLFFILRSLPGKEPLEETLKVFDLKSATEICSLELKDEGPPRGRQPVQPFLTARFGFFVDRDRLAIITPDFSRPGTVREKAELALYDISTRKPIYTLRESTAGYVVSPDRSRIAALIAAPDPDNDKKLVFSAKLWDASSGKETAVIPLPGNWAGIAVSSSGKRLATSSWSMNGPFLARIFSEPLVKIWDVESQRAVATLDEVVAAGLEFAPDDTRLATISVPGKDAENGTPTVVRGEMFDAATGQRLWSISMPYDTFSLWQRSLFSTDGQWVTFVQHRMMPTARSLTLRSAATGEAGPSFQGHAQAVIAAAFSSDQRLLTAAIDGTIKTWQVPVPVAATAAANFTAALRDGHSPGGKYFALATGDRAPLGVAPNKPLKNEITVRDTIAQSVLWKAPLAGAVEQIAFSPNERYLAVTFAAGEGDERERGHVIVYDAASGRELYATGAPLMGRGASVRVNPTDPGYRFAPYVAFSPDSRQMALTLPVEVATPPSWTIQILDAASGAPRAKGETLPGIAGTLRFSPDGNRILATAASAAAPAAGKAKAGAQPPRPPWVSATQAFDAATGKGLWRLNFSLEELSFSGDGTRICGHAADTVRVLATTSGAVISTIPEVFTPPRLAMSADGKRLALAKLEAQGPFDRRPGIVNILDADTGQELFSLRGHSAALTDIAFAPDGKRIATTAGAKAETKLWDAETGQEMLTIAGVDSGLEFSADGRQLTGWNGSVLGRFAPAGTPHKRLVVADATALADDLEAQEVVARFIVGRPGEALLSRKERRELIESDAWLSPAAKARALELLAGMGRDSKATAAALNSAAWAIARLPGQTRTDYERALDLAVELCEADPTHIQGWNTRGAAHYRLGEYREAIAAIERAIELRKGSTVPEDQVFLAMSHVQLGNTAQAASHLRRFTEMIKQSGSGKISEWRSYLNEASSLFKVENTKLSRQAAQVFAGWGEAVDPLGDCKFEISGSGLTIQVPGTLHSLSPARSNFDAPRVWQEVEGDFTARVKVTCPIRPQKTLTESGLSYVGAGFLLWENADNFMRAERNGYFRHASRPIGSQQQPAPKEPSKYASHAPLVEYWRGRREVTSGRNVWNAAEKPLDGDSTWLRIVRRGPTILVSISSDGRTWNEVAPVDTTLPTRIRIGVVAVNGTADEFSPTFSDWTLSQP